MLLQRQFDNLVKLGYGLFRSDSNEQGFQDWRRQAFQWMKFVLGGEHTYTQYFREFVRDENECDLLAGIGILIAAKEEVANSVDERWKQ